MNSTKRSFGATRATLCEVRQPRMLGFPKCPNWFGSGSTGGIVRHQCVINNMESERFRFGLFEFDTATRELRREGVLVRLQSQPAQVLACLIELAGQVVSREELRKILWGGETFVDFDRGLNFCISQVRSALRDQSMQPTYIRTIPKHGYQFIAPVERVSERAPGGEKSVPT